MFISILVIMNKLNIKARAQIIHLLCEGNSLRSISRLADVSVNTVTKLLVDAGRACVRFHDEKVQNVKARRIQCDEIWSFTYAKQKNVSAAKAAPAGSGDTWTWTAIDSDTKLLISWMVGGRDGEYAKAFMDDVANRVAAGRLQLTTDGLKAYLDAVEGAFGADVDYAQLVKLYGEPKTTSPERKYSPSECTGTRKFIASGNPVPPLVSWTDNTHHIQAAVYIAGSHLTNALAPSHRFRPTCQAEQAQACRSWQRDHSTPRRAGSE